ncbi:MAG: lipase family protein [bacterium]|nr:lipase family protein [bacterium]
MKLFLISVSALFSISYSLFAETNTTNYFNDLNISKISSDKLYEGSEDLNRLKNVLIRARQALLTYMPDSVVKEIYPNSEIHVTQSTKIKFISIVDSNTGVRMVCIRGNSNLKNWLVSMDAELVKGFLGDIQIHRGFLKGTMEVYESLEFQDLMKIKTTTTEEGHEITLKNIILGHSMGGAIAVLLAKKMQMEGHHIEEVVTFAQPMVTDSTGAELFSSVPLLRVGLDRDVVVYLPAHELGYKHMGQKLEFDSYNFRFFQDSTRDNLPWSPPEEREPLKEISEEDKSKLSPYFGIEIESSGLDEFVVAHSLNIYKMQIEGHIKRLSKSSFK